MKPVSSWPIRTLVGVLVGAAIAYVDNVAFQGEASPIVIVVVLLVAAAGLGLVWKSRAFLTVFVMWLWLPLAHVVKKMLGLPDTLQPNTYASIALLSAFTLMVASIGLVVGVSVGKIMKHAA